ncbi:UPF0172-domain-containing protein [Schizophyllum commune H4-8]|uniref:MPN domain-containing protein n=1 Tax=Schizophyllum commune (strain H4-8 / FGSC 9210) TaxID=578458 RepID=D8PXF6_SCHCM|nr:UPF0172-domain-containing protein [Schizophyllum commune H4-8]KAI5896896.1 UPF0172-domain-containing protein [Schizophyllum commune H4-8]
MPSYTFSDDAYLKLFFHCAKYPHRAVNGVLLGTEAGDEVQITDAVPLLHHWTHLSPMMEIGLDLAATYAASVGMKLVGYYQACERLDDTALTPVGEKVARRIRDSFANAAAFVIDGEQIGTGSAALVPYTFNTSTSSWTRSSSSFTEGSPYRLTSTDIPLRAVKLVRQEQREKKFGDFDDHLEDVTIDWLRNKACLSS